MAGDTVVTIVGNAVVDPDLRFTPSGAAVAKFRIASTPRTFDRQTNEWKDGESLFLTVNCWRQLGENVAATVQRGMRVVVQGRLSQRSYDKDGEKRTVYEIEADEVAPSLRNATATVAKTTRQQNPQQVQQNSQQPRQQPTQGGDPWASQNPQNPPQNSGWGGDAQPPF